MKNQTFYRTGKLLLITLVIATGKSGAQTPADDPHWIMVKEWDFKTMSFAELQADWVTDPCVKSLSPGDLVDKHFWKEYNVEINSTNGLNLFTKIDYNYGKCLCYKPDDYIMGDGAPNARWNYYSSGYVETLDSIKYGFIEARLKVPYGYDFFHAFYTFKKSSAAANGAEIDIFEMVPSHPIPPHYPDNNNIQKTNVHLFYGEPGNPYDPDRNFNVSVGNYSNYHTYAVEWSPSKIIWYFDGIVIRIMQNPGVHDFIKTILNGGVTPFMPLTNVGYPVSMGVDFVKWYQLDNSICDAEVSVCNFNFGGYLPKVRKSITIGGGGCTNVQPVGSDLVLRATTFVEIKGDFTVPLGAELYVDVNGCY